MSPCPLVLKESMIILTHGTIHAFLDVRKIMNKTLMHTLRNTHKKITSPTKQVNIFFFYFY
jgi:hypothetical protein